MNQMKYLKLYQGLANLNDVQFIEKVQNLPMKKDRDCIDLWELLILEMDRRRHEMYTERGLCKSYDEYKNNDLIDLYADIEENMKNKRKELLNKPKGRKEKQLTDEEFKAAIREHMEENNIHGPSYWQVIDSEPHEITSNEYYELLELGEHVFICE